MNPKTRDTLITLAAWTAAIATVLWQRYLQGKAIELLDWLAPGLRPSSALPALPPAAEQEQQEASVPGTPSGIDSAPAPAAPLESLTRRQLQQLAGTSRNLTKTKLIELIQAGAHQPVAA